MPKIVTIEQMRAIEAAADAGGHSYAAMMELAGAAVAEAILRRLSTRSQEGGGEVLVLVGPGNNGGDGLVAARYVKEDRPESEVVAYLLKARSDEVFQAAEAAGITMVIAAKDKKSEALTRHVMECDVLVHSLFGTGSRLPIEGTAASILTAVGDALSRRWEERPIPLWETPAISGEDFPESASLSRPYIIAVDCPSGVDCDSGECDPLTLSADETVTFAAAKPGLMTFPGADKAGVLRIAGIGLPDGLEEFESIMLELSSAGMVGNTLPDRPRDSHKGTFGKVFMAVGSVNYTGAAYLAAGAAYRVGAGLVTVGAPGSILPVLAGLLPEATWMPLPHDRDVINGAAAEIVRGESSNYSALLVGPGIGNEDETHEFMEGLLPSQEVPQKAVSRIGLLNLIEAGEAGRKIDEPDALPPLVIDADGLNILAQIEDWPSLVPENTIITPHPMEFSRLSGLDKNVINADRINIAGEKAAEWNVIVVLKGAFTVVAAPDGRVVLSPFASASLATAGSGDVLAGAIAGLLAQGLAPFEAAWVGVWLHGYAGTVGRPVRGNLASDVLDRLAEALNHAALSD